MALWLTLSAAPLEGQSYNVHHYSNRDGLPQAQVLAIHQDREGYLWFGTFGGLGRYNGASIQTYTTAHGLASNVVEALAEDAEGRLLLGTLGGGLCTMRGERFDCLSTAEGLPSADVTKVYVDRQGVVWFATDSGLGRYENGSIRSYTTQDGLPSSEILAVAEDDAGTLWVGTSRGLARLVGDRFEEMDLEGLSGRVVRTLLATDHGLLIGADSGLHLLADTLRRLSPPDLPSGTQFRDAARGADGRVWIATDGGLLRFDGEGFLLLTDANGLLHNNLLEVAVDREENVWFSSDAGVSKLVPGPFRGYGIREGLPQPFARALAEDADGRLWVGTRNGAVAWSPAEGRFVSTVPGGELPDPRVYSLARAPDGGMLVGTRSGLVHWREGSFRIHFREDGLPADYVLSLLADASGQVWIGTADGVARWIQGEVTSFPAEHPLSGLFAVSLAQDHEGRLWIGLASGGVRIWDGSALHVMDGASGLSDQVIWSLSADRQGGMWVGTNGDGAFRVDGPDIRQFTTRDGLANDFVWQVLADSEGSTWFYTNQGLDRYRDDGFRHFGEAEGLLDLEGTAGAALEDSEGRLWFGTSQGVMAYDPSAEHVNLMPPPVLIEDVVLGGRPLDLDGDLRFPPSVLQLRFGALTFRDERNVRFRYRLVRGDRDDEPWSDPAAERAVSFASLAPGSHTFEVIAINGDGIASTTPSVLAFTVLPRWWQTWWARVLGIALVLGLTAGIPILRNRRISADRKRLAVLVARRTEELESANVRLRDEIGERERFEAELQESEARLRQIVENSTIVFYSHTPGHEITYISPQVEELLGVHPDDVPERWTEFATDHPVNERGEELTVRALETGERQPPYELELRHDTGRSVWVRVTEAPVVRDGKAVAIVGSLTDITEARRAEQERDRLEEQLRQAQKMEAVGRLAGGIAHEFNNLLTSIVGNTELMAMGLEDDHPHREDLEEVMQAGRRAAGLVSQLLALGRRQMIQPSRRSLKEAVDDAMGSLTRILGRGVTVEAPASAANPQVHMDQSQLHEILVQLVRNAGDAMPEGGSVTVTTDLVELASPPDGGDTDGFVAGDYAVLAVADTGPGMTPETLDRLFEPFFTTKEMTEGAGLGLATVYGIVKQNDGYVRVDSAPGEGTTVNVYLPATPSASEEASPALPPATP